MEPAQERPRPAPLEDSTVLGLSGRAVMVVDARSPPPSVRGSRSPSRASLSRSAYSLEEKTDTNDVDSSPPQGVRGRIHTTSTTISPVRDDVKQVSLMERRFRETEVEWLRRHTAQSKEIRRLHRELAGTKKAAAEEVAEVRDWQRKAQYAQAYPDKVIRYLQEEMEAARTTNQSLATHISTLELQINVQHNAMLQGFPEVTFKVENYYPPDGSAPIPYYVPQRLDLLSGDFSEEATRRRQPPPQENIPPHFIPLDDHSEEYCDSESVLSEAESEGIHDNGPVPFISTVPPAQMCTKDVSLPAPPPEVAKKEVRTPDAAAILRAQQGHLVDLAARRPEQAGQMLRDEVQICRGGAGGNGVPRLFPHIAVGRIWAKKAAGRPPQMTSPPPQIRMTRNKDRSLAPKIPSVGISGFPGPTIAVPRPPSARNRKPMKGRSLVSARHKPSSEAPMNVQQVSTAG